MITFSFFLMLVLGWSLATHKFNYPTLFRPRHTLRCLCRFAKPTSSVHVCTSAMAF
ncbi:hypothetical protein M407DRAFT_180387 [Tulasnella calospora MUT 4182]|uniref:Uncharacterized protein n=1 Tax=Tulasnella calospora MUT 4182 TaxID=1051891 RepID=A0A0C3QLN3_9AGAM|nr:hypothetical protein M407DRAFT_180387 [Tulasnella calospora MUT 4182]